MSKNLTKETKTETASPVDALVSGTDITKILVLVELENGNVHQVLTSKEQKEIALRFMKNERHGSLLLSKEVEPIELEFKN